MTASPIPVYTGSLLAPEPWMQDALCAQIGGDAFFPAEGDKEALSEAREVCLACPVIDQCLAYAIRTGPTHGVWAGRPARQIKALRGEDGPIDAAHSRWVHEYTWHLEVVPPLMDALVEATLPRIPVSRGGSRFDEDRITGGGFIDNMRILDHVDVADDGRLVAKGVQADARELWSWVVQYTRAVEAWITGERPAPVFPDRPSPDPVAARREALMTVDWLIEHADLIAGVTDLEQHRDEMFRLIRHLRGRYGVFDHPRRARPVLCAVCGERAVVVDWIDGADGSPRPVQGGRCRTCGEVYRQDHSWGRSATPGRILEGSP